MDLSLRRQGRGERAGAGADLHDIGRGPDTGRLHDAIDDVRISKEVLPESLSGSMVVVGEEPTYLRSGLETEVRHVGRSSLRVTW